MIIGRNILKGSLALLLAFTVISAQASDGTVNITGTIKDNTCVVTPDSATQTVKMGSVASKDFHHAGDVLTPVIFNIDLTGCGQAVKGVTVSFSGLADSTDSSLLSITAGAGSANGLALALLDDKRNRIPLKDSSKEYPLQANNTGVSLIFYAQYVATATSVTPGLANANTTFTLYYS